MDKNHWKWLEMMGIKGVENKALKIKRIIE